MDVYSARGAQQQIDDVWKERVRKGERTGRDTNRLPVKGRFQFQGMYGQG